ncbi:unnamed protein product [Trichogramma brassicae]|uniref:Uncharacterized protein n=1 Tax=Trichogramma brassicae TaxID=86971 RepID=A0A6H5HWE0_9HYME|nr:unnamed protein product [Trichogramma brassicae]
MEIVLSDESDDGIDEMDEGRRLIKLTNLRDNVQWEVKRDRHRFLRKLYPLIRNWEWDLPDLLRIFRAEQIDRLLRDAVTCTYASRKPFQRYYIGGAFFKFVANCEYRDQPRLDQNREISPYRTTALHKAIHKECDLITIELLFDIYNEYGVNYTDGTGLTHFYVACATGMDDVVERFLYRDPSRVNLRYERTGDSPLHTALRNFKNHTARLLLRRGANPNQSNTRGEKPLHVACVTGMDDVVERFLDRGHDVNLCHERTGDSPLHLALHNFKNDTARLLLRRGANPNLPNARGETPLHVASKTVNDGHVSIKKFFEVIRELGLPVMIDARDKSGWTPLQCAVANALPDSVQMLLDHGADRSSFTFPTESHLLVSLQPEPKRRDRERYMLIKAAGLLESITKFSQEDEECILVQREALLVMSLFARYRWFETREDRESRWYDEETLQQELRELEEIVINEEMSLSLNDLIRLRPDDATAKLLTYRHYFGMGLSLIMLDGYDGLVARNLCEKMSREFFRSWTIYPFWDLIDKRLPVECCEMILRGLTNEDLYHICLAAEARGEKIKIRRTGRYGAIKRLGAAGERRRKILDRNKAALRSKKAPKASEIVFLRL